MSTRELCISLIKDIPESKLGYVLAYIQGLTAAADEDVDAAFCEMLYREYENDPNKGDAMPIEDVAALLGVSLDV